MSKKFDKVQASGQMTKFETGAVRDIQGGKGRFDLIPAYPMWRLARHFENGAKKYDDDNWKKGIPLRTYMNSANRHWQKLMAGWVDEDHAAAIMWNICGFIWTKKMIELGKLPATLDNMPKDWEPFDDSEDDIKVPVNLIPTELVTKASK